MGTPDTALRHQGKLSLPGCPLPPLSAPALSTLPQQHTVICARSLCTSGNDPYTHIQYRLIFFLLRTQEESLNIIFMHLIIGFLSLPCKVFISTLNPLFHTCVYTVNIYSIFLVVEYCIWVCILWHWYNIFLWVSLPMVGKKRKI